MTTRQMLLYDVRGGPYSEGGYVCVGIGGEGGGACGSKGVYEC